MHKFSPDRIIYSYPILTSSDEVLSVSPDLVEIDLLSISVPFYNLKSNFFCKIFSVKCFSQSKLPRLKGRGSLLKKF